MEKLYPTKQQLQKEFEYFRGSLVYKDTITPVDAYLSGGDGSIDGSYLWFDHKIYGKLAIHVCIYQLHTGLAKPPYVVDHINGDRLDNRIENLELETFVGNSENQFGIKAYGRAMQAIAGKEGVHYIECTNTYHVYFKAPHREYISWFDTNEAAQAEYTLLKTGVFANA